MEPSNSFDEEEIQQMLEDIARENGYKEPKFEVKAATKAGDNYVGRVIRAIIRESGASSKEPLSLIFKTAPTSKARRDAFRSGVIFCNEGNMYQIVLPALNSFLKEHGLSNSPTYPCTARCLYSKLSSTASENAIDVLVLEDMSTKGYRMVDRLLGLDADKCRVILRQLARLHAASLALQRLRPEEARKLESQITEVAFDENNPILKEMTPIVNNAINLIEDRYPPGSPEHTKLKNFLDNYLVDVCELVRPNDTVSCITHGDCWSNNVLFKFDEKGRVDDICLLDFQISRKASPVLDVVYLIFTCTVKKTRDDHYISLLHDYHDELSSFLEAFGCDPEEIFPWSMFQDQLKKYGRYGLLMALITVPLFLAESSEVPQDIDAMMENGNANLADIFTSVNIKRMDECKDRACNILLDCINNGFL